MHRLIRTLVTGLLALPMLLPLARAADAAGSPPAKATKPGYADYAGEPVQQFTAFRLDDFTVLDRRTLVLWASPHEAYLVKVWGDCYDLPFVEQLRVNRKGPLVTRLDSIRVRGRDCPIDEIRPVDLKKMKQDQAAAKAAQPATPG